ncbi:class I SAM-dependent methyltransferase [Entomobacter blattae]|uniref:S-adenosyl-L-methionine-dependent methyltransferase n=1 Tax=Entomobacter blattae TaxID=2762277 RepID=A0A7H1NQ89_9PROT|nr:SAM-dependent methyltransferase [Entomobacter blattae]QNT77949.1 Putative S-adenosyl-L-methionine-dependent methyltransferase [Entomobacter blattae]
MVFASSGENPLAVEQPLRLDQFMARANALYYAQHDPFADFTTAPEISQLFGEMIALWCISTWHAMGKPKQVLLAEAGPGRGTLMADCLRVISRVQPALYQAISIHLVETSNRLRAIQRQALLSYADRSQNWHDTCTALPDGALIFIANEFLDALPIRQFRVLTPEWKERYVHKEQWEEHSVAQHPEALRWVVEAEEGKVMDRRAPIQEFFFEKDIPEGSIIECNEPAQQVISHLAQRLQHSQGVALSQGAALFIDYGFTHFAFGDSLQALYQGKPSSPLHHAGEADLTAHVDFYTLGKIARFYGCQTGFAEQAQFLSQLGIAVRLSQLVTGKAEDVRQTIIAGYNRLAGKGADQMGELFKVMVMASPALQGIIGCGTWGE